MAPCPCWLSSNKHQAIIRAQARPGASPRAGLAISVRIVGEKNLEINITETGKRV